MFRGSNCSNAYFIKSIRHDAGDSLKAHISHQLTFDTRDDPILPKSGVYIRTLHEIAGLLGNVRHLKSETELQYSYLLPFGFVIKSYLFS